MTTTLRHGKSSLVLLGVLIALIVASLALSAPASADDDDDNDAPAPATISVGRFSNPLPVIVAQQKGFYAAENLTVIETQVGSSVDAYRALEAGSANGGYDILLNSSPDNVANYRLNAGNPLGTRLDIKAFFADNSGLNLTLMARPGITSAADLRGKVVAVDSPTSGFAYVLYKILRQAGLERDVDYTVVAKGTGLQRFQGLLAGEFDATLLNAGFEVRAANAGYVPVATVYDIANPYLGGTAVAKTSWLRQNEDVAVRFTRAYYKATQWSLDPANREEAINLLVTPFVSRAVAEQIYAKQMQAGVGLISDLRINQQALRNVLALRQEFGGFDQPQNLQLLSTPGGGLYTLSYLDEALDDDDDDDDD